MTESDVDCTGDCTPAQKCVACKGTTSKKRYQCINCENFCHISCAERKKFLIINKDQIICCEKQINLETINQETINVLLMKLLKAQSETIEAKDAVISAKDMVINSLRAQIEMMNINQSRDIHIQDQSEEQKMKIGNPKDAKENNSQKIRQKDAVNPKFTSIPVSTTRGKDFLPPLINTTSANTRQLENAQIEKMNEIINLDIDNRNNININQQHEDNFKLVINKKKKNKTSQIIGNNDEIVAEFCAPPMRAWFYVGHCSERVKENNVKEYIKTKLGVDQILEVKQLKTKGRNPSFQVGIDFKLKDCFMLPETWPKGIKVHRFNFNNKVEYAEESNEAIINSI